MQQLTIAFELSAHDQVAKDLMERKAVGIATYGRLLNRESPEDMLQMAYEEALDMACYLKTEMLKRNVEFTPEPSFSIPTHPPDDREVIQWHEFYHIMKDVLIPDYLMHHGGVSIDFTMNDIKDWMEHHSEKYPYLDTHKRMSKAITKLIRQGYFYRPSRYVLSSTAKYVSYLANLDNLSRVTNEPIPFTEGEDSITHSL